MKTTKFSAVRGFTIVELLVVIAIIGILAAILLPVLQSAVKHASMTKAKLEVNQIGNAIQQYESQYSRLPVSTAVQQKGFTNVTYGGLYFNNTAQQWPSASTSFFPSGNYVTNTSEVF